MTMDMQKTFDTVVQHLFMQGKQAVGYGGTCKYRQYEPETGATLKCAVGCLIPDELYKPEYEGSIGEVTCLPLVNFLLGEEYDASRLTELRSCPEMRLLITLQRVHDNERNWKEPIRLANVLHAVASAFGLDVGEIPDIREGETWEQFHKYNSRYRPQPTECAA